MSETTNGPGGPAENTAPENTAPHAALVLDAGGVLPPGTPAGDDADALTARTYHHPVLGGRTIVRLVPAALGPAEDLALEFLGLVRDTGAGTPEVGVVRRETLGFPAWALVNDPANGHHALALVRDMERLGRMAATRPGAARDGFAELAATLGRTVPHFLPTYCEEVARVFLARENTAQAAVWFNKAREAERVHSLAVDEDRLRAVFLEFAFAGALTAKAMREHTRALTARLGPDAAWEQVRRLAVERSAAGMAPYAGLAEDLRALLRRTGLDKDAEEAAVLRELLAGPAVARAPLSFWKTYAPALKAAAAADPGLRRRLTQIVPKPSTGGDDADDLWLDLLAATGAETLLTGPAADHPGVDAAGWLTTWAAHRRRGWRTGSRCPRTQALAERMAARLAEDGTPVDLTGRHTWRCRADIDLLDTCLAAGVPVADPAEQAEFDLTGWYGDHRDGRRDLTAVGADPRFAAMLRHAVGELATSGTGHRHLTGAARHPVLRAALRDHVGALVDDLEAARTLPALRAAIQRLSPFRDVLDLVRDDARARIAKVTLDAALARTLRTGIADELGWPALDEALATFDPKEVRERRLTAHEAWPALVIASSGRAVVVGPSGVLLEHDLRPEAAEHGYGRSFDYVDGDLLVQWWDGARRGYWASRPGEIFDVADGGLAHGGAGRGLLPLSLEHPAGGRARGGRPLHAGDTVVPRPGCVMHDGISWWALDRVDHTPAWVDHDPLTGARGRPSLPAFAAAAVENGGTLVAGSCMLVPLPPGMEGTPLGTDGRLLGTWVRQDVRPDGSPAGTLTAGTTDGTVVTVRDAGDRWGRGRLHPLGRLRLPGGAAPVLATDGGCVALLDGDDELVRVSTQGHDRDAAAGTPYVPPAPYWHAMRPRDEAASLRLRAVTDAAAAELLARARAERDAAREAAPAGARGLPDPETTARGLLGDTAHPALVTGLAAVLREADRTRESLERLTAAPAEPAEPRAPAYQDPRGTDARITRVLAGAVPGRPSASGGGEWTIMPQIHAVAGLLAAPRPGTAATGWTRERHPAWPSAGDWTPVLSARAVLAVRAVAPTTPPEQRETIAELLTALCDGPLGTPGGRLRRVVLRETHTPGEVPRRAGEVLRHGPRTVVVLGTGGWVGGDAVQWNALDHDPSGTFGAVDGFTVHDETRFTEPLPAATARALAGLVRDRGPVAWPETAAADLAAATGLSGAEAILLLAGVPGGDDAGKDALGADARALTRLKAGEIALARDALARVPHDVRAEVLAALVPGDPAALWTTGPDVAAAAGTWIRRQGTVVRLSPAVAGALGKDAGEAGHLLNHALVPWIAGRTRQRPRDGVLVAEQPDRVPRAWDLARAAAVLTRLAYVAPYGDPLRRHARDTLLAIRERLADPGLILDLDVEWAEGWRPTSVPLRQALGMPETGGEGPDGLVRAGDAFVLLPWSRDGEFTQVRPAGLADPASYDLLTAVRGEAHDHGVVAVRRLLSDDLLRLITAGTGDDAPAGYAQHPGLVVPGLVAEVAAARGLSEDAAAIYLMLLALPDPTDRNTALWTGWKPARLRRARAEVLAAGLVVEARRPRAGRTLFLPGGWHELKAPALPVETWKEGLYEPCDRVAAVVPVPVPELFRAAWRRVTDGAAPGFETLGTRPGRRRR